METKKHDSKPNLHERLREIRAEQEERQKTRHEELKKKAEERLAHTKCGNSSREEHKPIVRVTYGPQPAQPQPTPQEPQRFNCPLCFQQQVEKTNWGYECSSCHNKWNNDKELLTQPQQVRRPMPQPQPIMQAVSKEAQKQVSSQLRSQHIPSKKKKHSYNPWEGLLF